ncbi:hypothetical protein BDN72DRAFT_817724 [Pluteus cervinus]|uniref:Uncharacterized protein n=1 Tax=Pluteus cervinus TaxID=181527 RepID=A0ACD3B0E6_9AGAR|nr:hypothetical protein BDN72DRAFT_817724 [Pluteus cervinus]
MARPDLTFSQTTAQTFFNFARKWLTISSLATVPVTFLVNAPFGRFTPSGDSIFLVDGIKSWILMELVSPIMFTYCFFKSPLSYYRPALPAPISPQAILAACFLIHYANRAIISPLRTPRRSKSHIIVPMSAVGFNLLNGSMMGSYLSSPFARIFLTPDVTFARTSFWVGLLLWAVGFAGNIIHDEILLDIRRKAKVGKGKGKSKTEEDDGKKAKNGEKPSQERPKGEYYGIPQGWLYDYISYPNYFCEWVEWFGFALAASPLPFELPAVITSLPSLLVNPIDFVLALGPVLPAALGGLWQLLLFVLSPAFLQWIVNGINSPTYLWGQTLTPPHIFFMAEVATMFPRAWNGHKWYKTTFKESYPKDRKVVIPWIL